MTLKNTAIIVLTLFGIFSVWVVSQVGYIGIAEYQLEGPAGWQVLADLVIACVLLLCWIIPDARAKNRNPWGYVVLTLFLGSIGPLAYFALDRRSS